MTQRRGSKHNLSRAEYLAGMARAYARRGTDITHAKLNPQLVREIRASAETPSQAAARYGVHANTIMAVRRFERWGWVR